MPPRVARVSPSIYSINATTRASNKFSTVKEHDLTRAEPRSARLMDVLQFVPAAQVDPVYLDASYYVVPEAAGQRPYTLLFQALSKSGYVAIAQWTAHNREHMVLLRPGRHGLILHTLYYQDEVRAEDDIVLRMTERSSFQLLPGNRRQRESRVRYSRFG
jgi:Ku protein